MKNTKVKVVVIYHSSGFSVFCDLHTLDYLVVERIFLEEFCSCQRITAQGKHESHKEKMLLFTSSSSVFCDLHTLDYLVVERRKCGLSMKGTRVIELSSSAKFFIIGLQSIEGQAGKKYRAAMN